MLLHETSVNVATQHYINSIHAISNGCALSQIKSQQYQAGELSFSGQFIRPSRDKLKLMNRLPYLIEEVYNIKYFCPALGYRLPDGFGGIIGYEYNKKD